MKSQQINMHNGSGNNGITVADSSRNVTSTRRHVRFPEDDSIILGCLEPFQPTADNCTSDELIAAYIASCKLYKTSTVDFLLEQLRGIDLSICNERYSRLCLRGIKLNRLQIETLEEVFRRVHFQEVDLEETFLDEASATALFDMMLHYETCVELSISLNLEKSSSSIAWPRCVTYLRKSGVLQRFKLSHTPLAANLFSGLSLSGLSLQSLTFRDCGLTGPPLHYLLRSLRYLMTYTRNSGSSHITGINGSANSGRYLRPSHRGPMTLVPWGLSLHLPENRINSVDAESLLLLVRHQLVLLPGPPTPPVSDDPSVAAPTPTDKIAGGSGYLEELDLSHNSLGDGGVQVLCSGLIQAYQLQHRRLEVALAAIAQATSTSGLTPLATAKLPPECALPKARGLERLNLADNGLGNGRAGLHLAAVLRCSTERLAPLIGGLTYLDLSDNPGFRDAGVVDLCDGLIRNFTLRELFLRNVCIGFDGVFALSGYIGETKSLVHLDIRKNVIDVAGVMALARTLKVNRSLNILLMDTARSSSHSNEEYDIKRVFLQEMEEYLRRNRSNIISPSSSMPTKGGEASSPQVQTTTECVSVTNVTEKTENSETEKDETTLFDPTEQSAGHGHSFHNSSESEGSPVEQSVCAVESVANELSPNLKLKQESMSSWSNAPTTSNSDVKSIVEDVETDNVADSSQIEDENRVREIPMDLGCLSANSPPVEEVSGNLLSRKECKTSVMELSPVETDDFVYEPNEEQPHEPTQEAPKLNLETSNEYSTESDNLTGNKFASLTSHSKDGNFFESFNQFEGSKNTSEPSNLKLVIETETSLVEDEGHTAHDTNNESLQNLEVDNALNQTDVDLIDDSSTETGNKKLTCPQFEISQTMCQLVGISSQSDVNPEDQSPEIIKTGTTLDVCGPVLNTCEKEIGQSDSLVSAGSDSGVPGLPVNVEVGFNAEFPSESGASQLDVLEPNPNTMRVGETSVELMQHPLGLADVGDVKNPNAMDTSQSGIESRQWSPLDSCPVDVQKSYATFQNAGEMNTPTMKPDEFLLKPEESPSESFETVTVQDAALSHKPFELSFDYQITSETSEADPVPITEKSGDLLNKCQGDPGDPSNGKTLEFNATSGGQDLGLWATHASEEKNCTNMENAKSDIYEYDQSVDLETSHLDTSNFLVVHFNDACCDHFTEEVRASVGGESETTYDDKGHTLDMDKFPQESVNSAKPLTDQEKSISEDLLKETMQEDIFSDLLGGPEAKSVQSLTQAVSDGCRLAASVTEVPSGPVFEANESDDSLFSETSGSIPCENPLNEEMKEEQSDLFEKRNDILDAVLMENDILEENVLLQRVDSDQPRYDESIRSLELNLPDAVGSLVESGEPQQRLEQVVSELGSSTSPTESSPSPTFLTTVGVVGTLTADVRAEPVDEGAVDVDSLTQCQPAFQISQSGRHNEEKTDHIEKLGDFKSDSENASEIVEFAKREESARENPINTEEYEEFAKHYGTEFLQSMDLNAFDASYDTDPPDVISVPVTLNEGNVQKTEYSDDSECVDAHMERRQCTGGESDRSESSTEFQDKIASSPTNSFKTLDEEKNLIQPALEVASLGTLGVDISKHFVEDEFSYQLERTAGLVSPSPPEVVRPDLPLASECTPTSDPHGDLVRRLDDTHNSYKIYEDAVLAVEGTDSVFEPSLESVKTEISEMGAAFSGEDQTSEQLPDAQFSDNVAESVSDRLASSPHETLTESWKDPPTVLEKTGDANTVFGDISVFTSSKNVQIPENKESAMPNTGGPCLIVGTRGLNVGSSLSDTENSKVFEDMKEVNSGENFDPKRLSKERSTSDSALWSGPDAAADLLHKANSFEVDRMISSTVSPYGDAGMPLESAPWGESTRGDLLLEEDTAHSLMGVAFERREDPENQEHYSSPISGITFPLLSSAKPAGADQTICDFGPLQVCREQSDVPSLQQAPFDPNEAAVSLQEKSNPNDSHYKSSCSNLGDFVNLEFNDSIPGCRVESEELSESKKEGDDGKKATPLSWFDEFH